LNLNISSAVSAQVIIMAIYITLGFILTKIKFLTQSGTKQMSNLLINIVTPCVIISAFQDGFTSEALPDFVTAVILSIVFHVVSIAIVSLMYIKSKEENKVVNKFMCTYSNCGFMGIPLLSAALGSRGVFIGSAYLAVFNVFVWTQGYSSFSRGSQKMSINKIVFNPGTTGIAISLFILLTGIQLPTSISSVVEGLASLNTPIAMILLGIYLGESNILLSLKTFSMYVICIARLIILPACAIIAFKLLNINPYISLTVVLSASCPCAAIAPILASQFGEKSGYASSVVALSTLLSMLTLPLMAHFASMILN